MENKELEIGNKHKLSRASVMGLAPFVYLMMKSGDFDLTPEEELFVKGYINFGYIIIGVLVVAFILATTSYFTENLLIYKFLDILSVGMTVLGIGLIFIGIFLIHSGKLLFQTGSVEYKKISSGNTNILLSYIPVYNIILWYRNTDIRNYRWIKESILFRLVFLIIGIIIQNYLFMLILLLLGTIRIISALMGVDMIEDQYKEKLDKSFDKNPEEIYRYIKGPIVYLWNRLLKKIKKTSYMQNDINIYIDTAKKQYETINDRNNKITLIEYGIFFLLNLWILRGMMYIINLQVLGILIVLPYLIMMGRYIAAVYLNQMPPIPVIHEIVITVKKVIKF